jgi:3-phenylpropionate/cinnamic acid dioxygenase small subunit
MTENAITSSVRSRIESFIWDEAELLDAGRFEDWLGLFADDGKYWVPAQIRDADALRKISIFYEDKSVLAIRIHRMKHPANVAQAPFPRTNHLISQIRVRESTDGLYEATSHMHVVEYRYGDEKRIFAGKCLHTLRSDGAGFKIVLKRIDLIDCDAPQWFITVPI